MSMKEAWQILAAWWLDGDDAEKPATGSGEGYVPTLQADDTVKWRPPPEPIGHWEPVTNGDADSPEVVFSDGDVVMTFVED